MKTCPKCMRELKKVFNSDSGDELALESPDNEIILGNCYVDEHTYYCEYCDEFFKI